MIGHLIASFYRESPGVVAMPTLLMSSFDWDGLRGILDKPTAFAGRLAKKAKQGKLPSSFVNSALPDTESEITSYVERLFGAEDWYAGQSPRDARTIDGIISYLFEETATSKALKQEPISDGVMMEVLELAMGRAELDESRMMPSSRALFVKSTEPPPEDRDSELGSLGSRPFRHPSWNRIAAAELLRLNNPFVQGIEAAYFPDYSIHSPAEVNLLWQDMVRVDHRVRSVFDRVKSKRVRDDAIANFQVDLSDPIKTAASTRRALIARWDY